jgi:hypothetical protein
MQVLTCILRCYGARALSLQFSAQNSEENPQSLQQVAADSAAGETVVLSTQTRLTGAGDAQQVNLTL